MDNLKKPRAIGLVTDPKLRDQLVTLLPDYEFQWGLELPKSIQQAADWRPAVLLIDVDDKSTQWREIALGLQSSPATRRIPMLGIAVMLEPTPSFMELVTRAKLADELPAWIAVHARLWSEDYYAALSGACAGDLPEIVRQGIALFDQREFWEAHEVLEKAWLDAAGQPVGEVYRSILQVGVAYYQIQKGNYRGAIKMFLRAVQWLDPLPDACHGIDLARFKRDVAAARSALEALGAERIAEFDSTYFKPIPFVD